jgi:hypothetical protein
MRNIDMEIITSEKKTNLAFLLIATVIRAVGDTCHAYFSTEENVLAPLPLSLNSYTMAKAKGYKLIQSYEVDEEEVVHLALNINECKAFIKEIDLFIDQNKDSLIKQLIHNNRNCEFTTVTYF